MAGTSRPSRPSRCANPTVSQGNTKIPARWNVVYGAFIAFYFLVFTHDGIKAYFTADDVMNLYRAWVIPLPQLAKAMLLYFSTDSRPLPGAVERLIYSLAGFNPLPFRILCFGLILANLFLLYCFTRKLTFSTEIALLATLLVSYHAWFVDIYYNSSTLEELAAFFFYFASFIYYLHIRQQNSYPTFKQLAVLSLLFIGALDSKETSATLPVMVLVYEAIYFPPNRWNLPEVKRWLRNEARGAITLTAVVLPYVLAKFAGTGRLAVSHPLYHMDVSSIRYLKAFHLYINVLFYRDHYFGDAKTIELWIALATLAWLLRRRYRHLSFCFIFMLVSVLPFVFLPHYSGFFMYLPSVGWAIYIATLLYAASIIVFNLLMRLFGVLSTRANLIERYRPVILFLSVAVLLVPLHISERRKTMRIYLGGQAPIYQVVRSLDELGLTLPKKAHLLFIHNPFNPEFYTLLFTVSLYYCDPEITINLPNEGDSPRNLTMYDRVLDYRDGKVVDALAQPK